MKRRFSRAHNSAPRFITAKYADVCAETSTEIEIGNKALYDPKEHKCYCENSQTYKNFASAEFDRTWLNRAWFNREY